MGLASQLVVVKLELLAGLQDRRRPGRGAAAVAGGGLEAEGDDNRAGGAGLIGIRADGIEKTFLCRQILELGPHAWTCCAFRLFLRSARSASVEYIVTLGSSSRTASAQ